jgi:hypothetical protein
LSSLSNKTILHNEKTFQNNWFYYSYPYSGSSIFIFCEYSTTGRTTRKKAEALTDKFKQPSIKQLGILPPFLLALEITIISGTKNAT